ncbi:LTA synthase family protein [Enterococcus asini]|uniref:LTA synthase family protein n=1 Tax=Enterococcus asini TaxID=57732 RepID=UPI00288E9E88|nr:LTA synthase family protein [Enterococcus asini]MDT2756045.1 LTA synthase family protein [Enterococcus asini]
MKKLRYLAITVGALLLVLLSNLYLQWSQNNHSLDLALKFAFSWHMEKFFLGGVVLLALLVFLSAIIGSFGMGAVLYTLFIGILGYADYLKMTMRQEPIYPDDLKMVTNLGMMKDLIGLPQFILLLVVIVAVITGVVFVFWKSLKKPKKSQLLRVAFLVFSGGLLLYASNFNSSSNLLRKGYDRTALWIPYSQKMNYYNVGFVGGFLYNLKVEAMEKPAGYSESAVKKITEKYQSEADKANETLADEEVPNIVYVMSESFSDPNRLNGVEVSRDPLKDYYQVANQTYSGQMLSQNYGGGTANIEFEALTGFSMELLNAQMTTPYTLLVPKLEKLPSLVSLLTKQGYETTAIHPYDTSMYKRKDVYKILGFDTFLDQDTMKHRDKLQNNPYISDAAAYEEVLDQLDSDTPQMVHLVTMQTHMPYNGKYDNIAYQVTASGNTDSIKNYVQDVAYASQALKDFTEALTKLSRRTLVVFWGDHLPGIYSDETQAANTGTALHETEFLLFDSKGQLKTKAQNQITSPFYFAPTLLEQSGQSTTGFYQLLLDLQKVLPAFEKNMYYQNGQWQETVSLGDQEELYQDYQMIQYDILAGKQYSLQTTFFEREAS